MMRKIIEIEVSRGSSMKDAVEKVNVGIDDRIKQHCRRWRVHFLGMRILGDRLMFRYAMQVRERGSRA